MVALGIFCVWSCTLLILDVVRVLLVCKSKTKLRFMLGEFQGVTSIVGLSFLESVQLYVIFAQTLFLWLCFCTL
jgi:hypothetical protein